MKASSIVSVYAFIGVYSIPSTWGIMNLGNYPVLPQDRADFAYQPQLLQNAYPKVNPSVSPVQFAVNHGHLVQPKDWTQDHPGGISNIQIEMSSTRNVTGAGEQLIYFIVKNTGKEDEYIHVNVTDNHGYVQGMQPTEFYLSSGSTHEISVLMKHDPNTQHDSPDLITVNVSGRRSTVKRSAYYYPANDFQYGNQQQQQPFCYDRYVTGNCRYRTDPTECEYYKWTAYATIQSPRGLQQLRSIPDGLFIPEHQPGTREGLRVYLTVTCCQPIVQFLSYNPYYPNAASTCIVDVRELQGLNPAEIAAIVVGVIILLIIIVVIIALLIRRRRQRTILVGHTATPTRECVSRE